MKNKSLCTFSENEKMQKFWFANGERQWQWQWKSRTASNGGSPIEKEQQIKTNLRLPVFGNEQKAQQPQPNVNILSPSLKRRASFLFFFAIVVRKLMKCCEHRAKASEFSWQT